MSPLFHERRRPGRPVEPVAGAPFDLYRFGEFARRFDIDLFITGRSDREGNEFDLAVSNFTEESRGKTNLAVAREYLGVKRIFTPHQTHSAEITILDKIDQPPEEADGVIFQRAKFAPGDVAIGVKTADCLPVGIYDPSAQAGAIVHAGRAGTMKGVTRVAIERLRDSFGIDPRNSLVALGPAIRRCCYEVDQSSARLFARECGAAYVDGRMVDIIQANRAQAIALGVKASSIIDSGICSACSVDRFFSYRAENRKTGRFLTGMIYR